MEQANDSFPSKDEVEAELLSATIKSFCPQCGREIQQSGRGRPRKFCSAECLRLWRNKNQCPPLRRTAVERICPVCGKPFLTDRLNSRPKKFCSRACANMSRRKHGEWKDGIWVNEAEMDKLESEVSRDAGSS